MVMEQELIQNITNEISGQIVENAGETLRGILSNPPEAVVTLITIIKAIGIAFILYVIYLIIKLIWNWKNKNRLKRIEDKLNSIDLKLDRILGKKRKRDSGKK